MTYLTIPFFYDICNVDQAISHAFATDFGRSYRAVIKSDVSPLLLQYNPVITYFKGPADLVRYIRSPL